MITIILIYFWLNIIILFALFLMLIFFGKNKYNKISLKNDYENNDIIDTIIPVKNGDSATLRNIINLLDIQSNSKNKIIVVIEDEEEEIFNELKELSLKSNNIKLIISGKPAENVMGKAHNMLAGLRHSSAKYICFKDDDVGINELVYQNHLDILKDKKCGGVFTPSFYENSENFGSKLLMIMTNYNFSELLMLLPENYKVNYATGACMTYKREALEKVDLESLQNYISDDGYLGNNVYKAGYNIGISSKPAYMDAEDYNFVDSVKHLFRWLVVIKKVIGWQYLLVPSFFTIGNLSLIFIITTLFDKFNLYILFGLIIAIIYKVMVSIIQDKFVHRRIFNVNHYLFIVGAGIIQPYIWFVSLFLQKLIWHNRIYKVGKSGKIISIKELKV